MSFVTDFDPTRGDVIYGISPARTKYRDAFTQYHQTFVNKSTPDTDPHFQMLAALGWHQMDEYNNYFGVPTVSNAKTGPAADQFLAQKAHTATTDPVAVKAQGRVQAYQAQISTSRFSPSTVFQASKTKLDSEGYRANQFQDSRNWLQKLFGQAKNKSAASQALEQSRNYLAIRRACKFGIGLVATDPAFQHAIVHFVLDGLDMQEVCQKGTRQSTSGGLATPKTFVSITVSELRYVYRNWGKLSAKVVLYVDQQPVQPPWITDWGVKNNLASVGGTISARKDLWDQYAQDRALKHAHGLPNLGLV